MSQAFGSYFLTQNPYGSTSDVFSNPTKLQSLIGKYKGIDFNTGKTVDLALEQYKNALAQKQTPDYFPAPPSTSQSGTLTPSVLTTDDYQKNLKALEDSLFKLQAKENVLNLGAATAFGAASLPFTEYMRNQDFARQAQAYKMRQLSPEMESQRSLQAQQQASLASSSWADKIRAYSEAKRNYVEPFIRRV